ncbi:uncharacterized protein with von Willebrand factor type A (vWA) domain [Alkalibacillus flavidus]|uniref:Uncharacterized protein with von Willebrand factor type A (VWA) domain n=1 Tax=Alkalibacillus flavidus TaxID=546021 RepID=A0ABV2KW19_9BACI
MGFQSGYYVHGYVPKIEEKTHGVKRNRGKTESRRLKLLSDVDLRKLIQSLTISESCLIPRVNHRQSWLNHFRTARSLVESQVNQVITVHEEESLSVLLLDCSTSMRSTPIIKWLQTVDKSPYHLMLCHRERLYQYPQRSIEQADLDGGTSFTTPISTLCRAAEKEKCTINITHVTDGEGFSGELDRARQIVKTYRGVYQSIDL